MSDHPPAGGQACGIVALREMGVQNGVGRDLRETLADAGTEPYNYRALGLTCYRHWEVRTMSEERIGPELTIREAAKLLGLRPRVLRSYVKSGELESRSPLWRRRVSPRDLVTLVSKHAREKWAAVCAGLDAEPVEKREEGGPELLDDWELVTVPPREQLAALASEFDGKIARTYQLFPLDLESQPKKCLAAVPTGNPQLNDELSRLLGGTVESVVAHRNSIRNRLIVERLIHRHFPDPDGIRPLIGRADHPLDQEPLRAFLEATGAVLKSKGSLPIMSLLSLIVVDSIRRRANGIEIMPTEYGPEVHLLRGDSREQISPLPSRLLWDVTLTAMAVFGMDPAHIDSPQRGRAEARFKNGNVHVDAKFRPGEFGPVLSFATARRLFAEPVSLPAS